MNLQERHLQLGAALAPDGVPLHYGDQTREYQSAFAAAVVMERSHEGRLMLTGRDRLNMMHRISTNDLLSIPVGAGRPTIFTSPNARILDRAQVFVLPNERVLVLTEPGRGDALKSYLQRNIFFNDEVLLTDLAADLRQFVLHGANADTIIKNAFPGLSEHPPYGIQELEGVTILRDKPLVGGHWRILTPEHDATAVWDRLLDAGAAEGLVPAGSLTYNALRIQAARPGVGRELSSDYIPLEVGLWDEVSFKKGCYTGQEIIARMESRGKLAKTIVALTLDAPITAPVPIVHDGREVGILTSSVTTPDGTNVAIGVIKLALAVTGQIVTSNGVNATITRLTGAQPPD